MEDLRLRRGLEVEELAAKAGVTVSLIEEMRLGHLDGVDMGDVVDVLSALGAESRIQPWITLEPPRGAERDPQVRKPRTRYHVEYADR